MGGDLTVASEPGGGSRFASASRSTRCAERPLHAAEGAVASAAAVRPLNILCAEDNPYGRVVLNTILTELGHRADFVGTGEAAVEAVARGGYDLVLMDVTLPDLDGSKRPAASARSWRRRAACRSSACRAAPSRRRGAGRAAGMDGYLIKPLSPSALTQVWDRLAQPVDPTSRRPAPAADGREQCGSLVLCRTSRYAAEHVTGWRSALTPLHRRYQRRAQPWLPRFHDPHHVGHDPVDLEILRRVDGGDAGFLERASSSGGTMPPTTTGTRRGPPRACARPRPRPAAHGSPTGSTGRRHGRLHPAPP